MSDVPNAAAVTPMFAAALCARTVLFVLLRLSTVLLCHCVVTVPFFPHCAAVQCDTCLRLCDATAKC